MKAKRLSQLLTSARKTAEQQQLESARDAYRRALERTAREATSSFRAITAAAWQPPPEGQILTPLALQKLAARLNGDLESVWTTVILDVPGGALARAGIAWDVAHPLAQGLLQAAAQRTGAALGDAVQPVLRKAIGDAYTQGLSVVDAAANIRAAIADASQWQAEMLARTDLNSLANGASHAAARLVGAGYKTWDATLDDRTRETHADAHGQTVPLDATFDVGGESLDYPGDPAGSDAETINCRCAILYADTLSEGQALLADGGGTIMGGMAGIRKRARQRSAVAAASQNFRGARGLVAATMPEVRWVSDLAFEGEDTVDGRYFLPGAFYTRELPLTLMAMTVTDDGHDGAFVAGRIDKANRRSRNMDGAALPEGVKVFHASGVFDMGGANGAEVARLVGDETLRGVSVDYAVLDWVLRDPETGELIEPADATPEQMDAFFFGDLQMAARKAEILAATVCPTPAFANTRIALAASANGERVARLWVPLTLEPQALTAAAAPSAPPRAWFETQEPPGKMPLTITDEGRVFGHLADWSSCHISFLPACIPPPKSASNYAYFHHGEIETAEGDRVAVGKLMVGGRHDNNLSHGREEAMRHYDDLSRVGAVLRATDGKHGIWVCGALHHSVTDLQVADMKLNPPSGDWRVVNGQHELICGLSVPVPGFPIPRAEMQLVASGGDVQMGALVASLGPEEADPAALAQLASAGMLKGTDWQTSEESDATRRINVLAARAEGLDALLALAEEPPHRELVRSPASRKTPPPAPAPNEPAPVRATGDDSELDDQVAAALGTLAHVTDMASRLANAEQRATEMADAVTAAQEQHRQETTAQKRETLAAIESMTARIAAGEQITEAMLSAMSQLTERKPRSVKVIRDDNGRAIAYEEATA